MRPGPVLILVSISVSISVSAGSVLLGYESDGHPEVVAPRMAFFFLFFCFLENVEGSE